MSFVWNQDLKISFSRNHQLALNCDHIHPLVHLRDRYFLSTASGSLALSSGELDVSPLAIIAFTAASVLSDGFKTSFGTCHQRLMVYHFNPLFSTPAISNVQWDSNSDDPTPLELHYEVLSTPPPIRINRTVIDNFDELFQLYDSQLISDTLQKADNLIDQIEETTKSTYVKYLAFIALGLSMVNFIVFCCLSMHL